MQTKTAIQKGKALEIHTAQQIEYYGLAKARRSIGSGSGTREKADIDTDLMILDKNAGFECKNYKKAHVQDWWKQAQKLEKLGREPIVVYKLFGEPMGEAKAIIYLDTFLQLLKGQNKGDTGTSIVNKEDKWIIQSGIEALKKIIKVLEKYL